MATTSTIFSIAGRCFALLVLSCVLVVPAGAAEKAKAKGRDTTAGKPGKLTFSEAPSHESATAREKRLKRECKGRPNAGMCLGYTR